MTVYDLAELREHRPDQQRWVRAAGVELLGEYEGGGWSVPRYLVRRDDGQFAQLTGLIYRVLEQAGTPATPAELAATVGDDEQPLDPADIEVLLAQLEPVGLVEPFRAPDPDVAPEPEPEATTARTSTPLPTADPILALSLRGTLLPARVVRWIARPLALTFHPPVVVTVAVLLVAGDIWLARTGGVLGGLDQLIATPLLVIPMTAIPILLAGVHELGHAAGCHYSGGRPGRIGFGVYIVWPAFFTDVTDTYRLSRRARIRTDLGGFYYSVIGILLVLLAYAVTGFAPLALLAIGLHLQAIEQLMPFVRQDGYYLLGDVAGVPDLFATIPPVLRSALPGRPVDPRVADLRRGARRLITGWVLLVIPFLATGLAIGLWMLPRAVSRGVESLATHADGVMNAVQDGRLGAGAYAAASLLLLLVPVAGATILVVRVARALRRLIRRRRPVGQHTRRSS